MESRVNEDEPSMVLNEGPRIVTVGALSSATTSTITVFDAVMPRKLVSLSVNA